MGKVSLCEQFLRFAISVLAGVTLAGHDAAVAYANSSLHALAPETAFPGRPSASQKKTVAAKPLWEGPLFSKESILKGTRLWSELKKMNGGVFPALVDLKGDPASVSAQFAEKTKGLSGGSMACLSLEVNERELDKCEPGLLRSVTRYIVVADTISNLRREFKKHIVNGDIALHQFQLVICFFKYEDERTVHWHRISLGKLPSGPDASKVALLLRSESSIKGRELVGRGLMRRPLENIVTLLKSKFPGYALTVNAVNQPFFEKLFRARKFSCVRAVDLRMTGVIRQVRGIEGSTVKQENILFARIPEGEVAASPVQMTLDMPVAGEASRQPSPVEELAARMGLSNDLAGGNLVKWLRDHDLTLSYPRIVDIYGDYDANELVRYLYKQQVREIKSEIEDFSREAGVYEDTARRIAGRVSREELYPLILWMADLKFKTQKREDREGKLFGKDDVRKKKLRELPIWPVDENDTIREDLIDWMRISGRAPPPEYYLVRKLSYDVLAKKPPKFRAGRQLAFDFGGKAQPKNVKKKPAKADYMQVNEPYYSGLSMKDGQPVSFANAHEAKAYGERLVVAGRAVKHEQIEVLGRKFDVIVEKGAGLTDAMVKAMIAEAVNRTKAAGGDISKIPSTLVFGLLDTSSHLFEDHTQNGFIGINRALYEIKEDKVRNLLLQVGLFHELCHEATGLSGDAFEAAQMARDAEFAAGEAVREGIPTDKIYELLLPMLTPRFAVFAGMVSAIADGRLKQRAEDAVLALLDDKDASPDGLFRGDIDALRDAIGKRWDRQKVERALNALALTGSVILQVDGIGTLQVWRAQTAGKPGAVNVPQTVGEPVLRTRVLQPLSLPKLIEKSGLTEAQIDILRRNSAGVMTLYEFLREYRTTVNGGYALGLTSFVSYRDFYDAVAAVCGLISWDDAHRALFGDRDLVRTNHFMQQIIVVKRKPVVFFVPHDIFVYPESATAQEIAWCLTERNRDSLKNAYFVFGLYDAINDKDYNSYFSDDSASLQERLKVMQNVFERFEDHLAPVRAEKIEALPVAYGNLKQAIEDRLLEGDSGMFRGSIIDIMSQLGFECTSRDVISALEKLSRDNEIIVGVDRDMRLRIARVWDKSELDRGPHMRRYLYERKFGADGGVVTPYTARQLFLRLESARFLMDAYNNRSMGFDELAQDGSERQKEITVALERPIVIAKDLLARRVPLKGRVKDIITSAGEFLSYSGTYPEDLIAELSLDSIEKMAAHAQLDDEVDWYFASVRDALGVMRASISAAETGEAQGVDGEVIRDCVEMCRALAGSYAKWSDKPLREIEEMFLYAGILPFQPDHAVHSILDKIMRYELEYEAGRGLIDSSS
ncbi:MAG TPA: hypothetical protein P5287_02795 [bacterium]|nr:hypothetical protein [bacterium]